MRSISRRRLLTGTAAGALLGALGRVPTSGAFPLLAGESMAAGRFLKLMPFLDEPEVALDETWGGGLAGRRCLDLARVTGEREGQEGGAAAGDGPVISNQDFFVRTRVPSYLEPEGWVLGLRHLRQPPQELSMEQLLERSRPQGVHLIEGASNGSAVRFGMISAAEWSGVPVAELVATIEKPEWAARVLVSGFDRHLNRIQGSQGGADWVFTPAQLESAGAFLATGMNGAPLPPDHGGPLRLVVPGWYGCAAVKWVRQLILVPDHTPATSQMREYARRTHQRGVPASAREYEPAVVDPAALVTRVEKWRLADGSDGYRLVGLSWGGRQPVPGLELVAQPQGQAASAPEPIASFAAGTPEGWSVWVHPWRPPVKGRYRLRLRVPGEGTRTRRLSAGHYDRDVYVE